MKKIPTWEICKRDEAFSIKGVMEYDRKHELVAVAKKEELTKTKRFGWKELDEKGTQLQWISKKELKLDTEQYQRSYRHEFKIRRLAREWDHRALTALTVARRPNGDYFVVDGGHRLLAAWKRDDVDLLPCLVYDVSYVHEEASVFRKVNSCRSFLPSAMNYKAALAEGDAVAWGVENMMKETGYGVNMSGEKYCVKCIATVLKWYERDKDAVESIWPIVCAIHDGDKIDNRIFQALVYIEHCLRKANSDKSISQDIYRESLLLAGKDTLLHAIEAAKLYHTDGGVPIWAEGVLNVVNKKRSKHRIILEN